MTELLRKLLTRLSQQFCSHGEWELADQTGRVEETVFCGKCGLERMAVEVGY